MRTEMQKFWLRTMLRTIELIVLFWVIVSFEKMVNQIPMEKFYSLLIKGTYDMILFILYPFIHSFLVSRFCIEKQHVADSKVVILYPDPENVVFCEDHVEKCLEINSNDVRK